MSERKGDWMQSYTGRQIYLIDPRPEDIDIQDIAHALSNQCRYNGHCLEFYSVAQHSVHVSQVLVSDGFPLCGLLHDAAEAYLGDIIRPLKRTGLFDAYASLERLWESVIEERFGLLEGSLRRAEVHRADNAVLMAEKRDIVRDAGHKWFETEKPWEQKIVPWSPTEAKVRFMERFYELGGKR